MPNWTPTPYSSNVAGFGYDAATKTLTVEFKSGGKYDYQGVSSETFAGLQAAESKGKFIGQHIKGKHAHVKQEAKK